jgi:uncharacterized membrane protein YcfT
MASVRAPEAGRLGWIDAVRGACVLAVVLFHATAWHVLTLDLAPVADRTWSVVNGYLGSLRMPLLLAVSGLLASRRILQGSRSPDSAERAASSYYLYVVWLAVYVAVYAVLGDPGCRTPSTGPGRRRLSWSGRRRRSGTSSPSRCTSSC